MVLAHQKMGCPKSDVPPLGMAACVQSASATPGNHVRPSDATAVPGTSGRRCPQTASTVLQKAATTSVCIASGWSSGVHCTAATNGPCLDYRLPRPMPVPVSLRKYGEFRRFADRIHRLVRFQVGSSNVAVGKNYDVAYRELVSIFVVPRPALKQLYATSNIRFSAMRRGLI